MTASNEEHVVGARRYEVESSHNLEKDLFEVASLVGTWRAPGRASEHHDHELVSRYSDFNTSLLSVVEVRVV